ncbi:MAG: aminoacyl-tRNA hydrolase [Chitinispirillaceae bacterium]|nr:aminoacyl-tRNA hydrolase [Chitinispirillaceae bacterium]
MGGFSFFRRLRLRADFTYGQFDVIYFGLGNPGKKYFQTRHNIGFRVIDSFNGYLSDRRRIFFPGAEFIRGKLQSAQSVAAIKPLTFMNRSGLTVKAVLEKCKTPQNRCLVIVDDVHLPLGTMRARRNGSDGGHNGLKSIIGQIGPDFPRLRIGTGPLPEGTEIIDFVLGNFSGSEEKIVSEMLAKTHEILKLFAAEGIDAVMNSYN